MVAAGVSIAFSEQYSNMEEGKGHYFLDLLEEQRQLSRKSPMDFLSCWLGRIALIPKSVTRGIIISFSHSFGNSRFCSQGRLSKGLKDRQKAGLPGGGVPSWELVHQPGPLPVCGFGCLGAAWRLSDHRTPSTRLGVLRRLVAG